MSDDVEGRSILEVGSLDVNGSARVVLAPLRPARYLGVDISAGPGVDECCDVRDLVRRFGPDSFDVVVTTEVVEHIADWRVAFTNMKAVLRPGGVLVLTTRSPGFPYHGYPHDYWRYTLADMRRILLDMELERLEADPSMAGVMVKARKPNGWTPADLEDVELVSVLTHRREPRYAPWHRAEWEVRRRLPGPVKQAARLVLRVKPSQGE